MARDRKGLAALIQEHMRRAVTAYEEALRAQMDGDWARYGEAIKRLGEILKQ